MKRQFLAIALATLAASALADQTAQTTPETYVSTLGRYRLTVFPLEEEGALRTHSELMVRLPPTIERAVQARCEATLERWVGNSYEFIWRKPLVNKVSPESALVSAADGSFVTFDDWGRSGYGENVVVIYSGKGDLIRKFALGDLMTKAQVEKLPHTIGSIRWGAKQKRLSSCVSERTRRPRPASVGKTRH